MSNKNKIVLAVVVVVILGLSWFYWMNYQSAYAPSPEQGSRVQPSQQVQIMVGMASNAQFTQYLVGPSGMALYFKKGELNSSSCYGQCAINWPPLLADGELVGINGIDGELLGTVDRTDGTKQVAYDGKPLYYWVNDKNLGDTTGDGFGNIWSVATP